MGLRRFLDQKIEGLGPTFSKARIFTEQLTGQVRGGKVELHEWFVAAKELKREITTWKSDP